MCNQRNIGNYNSHKSNNKENYNDGESVRVNDKYIHSYCKSSLSKTKEKKNSSNNNDNNRNNEIDNKITTVTTTTSTTVTTTT